MDTNTLMPVMTPPHDKPEEDNNPPIVLYIPEKYLINEGIKIISPERIILGIYKMICDIIIRMNVLREKLSTTNLVDNMSPIDDAKYRSYVEAAGGRFIRAYWAEDKQRQTIMVDFVCQCKINIELPIIFTRCGETILYKGVNCDECAKRKQYHLDKAKPLRVSEITEPVVRKIVCQSGGYLRRLQNVVIGELPNGNKLHRKYALFYCKCTAKKIPPVAAKRSGEAIIVYNIALCDKCLSENKELEAKIHDIEKIPLMKIKEKTTAEQREFNLRQELNKLAEKRNVEILVYDDWMSRKDGKHNRILHILCCNHNSINKVLAYDFTNAGSIGCKKCCSENHSRVAAQKRMENENAINNKLQQIAIDRGAILKNSEEGIDEDGMCCRYVTIHCGHKETRMSAQAFERGNNCDLCKMENYKATRAANREINVSTTIREELKKLTESRKFKFKDNRYDPKTETHYITYECEEHNTTNEITKSTMKNGGNGCKECRRIAQINASIEKYGTSHPSQNLEVQRKQLQNAFHKKECIIGGRTFKYLGFEDRAIRYLLHQYKYDINDIVNDTELLDIEFNFAYCDQQDKPHQYFPDIYVKSHQLYVEVKSPYTYDKEGKEKDRDLVRCKLQCVVDAGYSIQLIIFDKKGTKVIFKKTYDPGMKVEVPIL